MEELREENEENEKETNEEIIEEERLIDENIEEDIISSSKEQTDTFITYKIHIKKEGETIESIASLYNVSPSLVEEYNDKNNLNVGDKIIIPEENE